MEVVELVRDAEANNWVLENAPDRVVNDLQAWARQIINRVDEDDCAFLSTVIHEAREQRITADSPSMRAHVYGLIFQWDDGRKGVYYRAALRVDDSNRIVEFIPVDV